MERAKSGPSAVLAGSSPPAEHAGTKTPQPEWISPGREPHRRNSERKSGPGDGAEPEGPGEAARRSRTPVLIVVEDEANDFMLLKRALWKAGATARVWWAHNAAEALSLLQSLQESTAAICMVCDVRLLGLDGFDLLDRVKATKTTCTVKFAFLTGMCDRATERRAQAQGANGFFIKPSDPADLTNIARQLQKLALE